MNMLMTGNRRGVVSFRSIFRVCLILLHLQSVLASHAPNKMPEINRFRRSSNVKHFGIDIIDNEDDSSCDGMSPVLLIPGLAGSVVEMQLNINYSLPHSFCHKKIEKWTRVWLSLDYFIPELVDCAAAYLSLDYKGDGVFQFPQGVNLRVPDFGGVDAIMEIDPSIAMAYFSRYYKDLVKALEKKGYTVGKNLFGAPYDFRFLPDDEPHDFKVNVKALIEEAYVKGGNRSVLLVAHSFGGPYIYDLLLDQTVEWREKHIKTLVTISSPWIGTSLAVHAIVWGDSMGVPTIKARWMYDVARSMPSLYGLLPDPAFKVKKVAQTEGKVYTNEDYFQLFQDAGVGETGEFVKTKPYTMFSRTNFSWPEGIKKYIAITNDGSVDTIDYVNFKKGFGKEPTLGYGPGDGTVDLDSLRYLYEKWNAESRNVELHVLKGVGHVESIYNDETLSIVLENACAA